jgi:FkbM family methyltransferase
MNRKALARWPTANVDVGCSGSVIEMSKIEPAALDSQTPFGLLRFPPLARIAWMGATGRAIPREWRKRIRKRFARRFPGPFDRVVEGIKFRLYPSENHSDRVMAGRGELPEIPERKLIDRFITGGLTFVDIGANIGVYSLYVAARSGGTATVAAFEPHPRTFEKLSFNCKANGFDSITCFNAGIGPTDGETILFSDGGGNIGGASMLREAAGDKVATSVRMVRLDRQLRDLEFASIDLLKIDIEGYEDRALIPFFSRPGNRDLFPRAILLETVHQNLWQDDLLGHLGELSYRIETDTGENVLLVRRIGP